MILESSPTYIDPNLPIPFTLQIVIPPEPPPPTPPPVGLGPKLERFLLPPDMSLDSPGGSQPPLR